MRRRGTAIVTILLILLFALLVVIGLILMTVQRTTTQGDTESNLRTYADAQAAVALSGLLRQPYPADLDGDKTPDAGSTLADAIALNDASADESLKAAMLERMPKDAFWAMDIAWPDRTISITAVDPEKFPKQLPQHMAPFKYFQDVTSGRVSITLANGISVTIWLGDANPRSVFALQEARS